MARPRPAGHHSDEQRNLPPILRIHERQVPRAYHHTLFTMSAEARAPLAASLLLPFSEQTSSTISQMQSITFWIVARWHKKTPHAREATTRSPPTRYVWRCIMPAPSSEEEVTEDHWLAINMRPFLNRTYTQARAASSTTSVPPNATATSTRSGQATRSHLRLSTRERQPRWRAHGDPGRGGRFRRTLRTACHSSVRLPCPRAAGLGAVLGHCERTGGQCRC